MNTLRFYVIFIIALSCILIIVEKSYQITPERAKREISTLIGTSDYDIINMSNNSLVFGTPGDVTFNLKINDSTVVSCRCTDSTFQPLICRKYE